MLGYLWQKHKHDEQVRQLNNKLAETQQLIKETNTAFSSAAIELENLKAQNKDLQKVIEKNKEKVFAMTDIALQWKDKYYEIKDGKQTNVDESGSQPASVPSECESCLSKVRTRIDFDHTKDNLRITGFTLTNPAYISLKLDWIKDLELNLVLTKNDQGNFKVYIDSKNSDFTPVALSLKVDPSILDKKWYEKIALGVDIGASQFGLSSSFRAMYGIKHNLYLGPAVSLSVLFTGQVAPFYGLSVLWSPFMRQ